MVQVTASRQRRHRSSLSFIISAGLIGILCSMQCACGGNVGAVSRLEGGDRRYAEDIIRAVNRRYATCRSYEDAGEVVSVTNARNKSERRLKFRTMFDRSTGGFVFTFADADGTRGTIWRRPSEPVRSWWTVRPEMVEIPNVSLALAYFTAISGGAAAEIPSLLFRISTGTNSGRNFYRDMDESVRDVPCYKIVSSRGSDTTTLWIEKDSLAIRRTESRSFVDLSGRLRSENVEGRSAESDRTVLDWSNLGEIVDTTEYDPAFDRQVERVKFDLKPPPL